MFLFFLPRKHVWTAIDYSIFSDHRNRSLLWKKTCRENFIFSAYFFILFLFLFFARVFLFRPWQEDIGKQNSQIDFTLDLSHKESPRQTITDLIVVFHMWDSRRKLTPLRPVPRCSGEFWCPAMLLTGCVINGSNFKFQFFGPKLFNIDTKSNNQSVCPVLLAISSGVNVWAWHLKRCLWLYCTLIAKLMEKPQALLRRHTVLIEGSFWVKCLNSFFFNSLF